MKSINPLTNLNGITGLLKQLEITSLLLGIVFTSCNNVALSYPEISKF